MASNETEVWDTDARIQYSSGWELTEVPCDETCQEATFHSSIGPGSTASLSFYGSQITVNGYVFQGGAAVSARYSVDGGEAALRTEESNNGSQVYLSTDLYTSDALPLTQHNITVEVVETSSARNYSVIYFLVHGADQGVAAASSITTSSSSTSRSQGTQGTPVLSSTSAVSSESADAAGQRGADDNNSGVSLGTVIGIVFGAVGLLVVLAALFFLLRGYSKRKKEELSLMGDNGAVPTQEVTTRPGGSQDRYGAVHSFIMTQHDSATPFYIRSKSSGGAIASSGSNQAMQPRDLHSPVLVPSSSHTNSHWTQAHYPPQETHVPRDYPDTHLSSPLDDQLVSVDYSDPPAYEIRAPKHV